MRILCVHIEGLGKVDGTGAANGYLLTTDLPDGFPRDALGYDWRPVLPQGVDIGETTIEPYSVDYRFPSWTVSASAGRQQRWLAELLLSKQTNGVTVVNEPAFSSSDSTLTVGSAGNLTVGDVIYIGAETLYISGISGSDLTVTRGYYGSIGAEHAEGSTVYTRAPFFEGRLVRVFTYDTEDGALVTRARGLIDGQISMDFADLAIPVRSLVAPLSDARINRFPYSTSNFALMERAVPDDADTHAGAKYFEGTVENGSAVKKDALANGAPGFFEIDGDLYAHKFGALKYRLFVDDIEEINRMPLGEGKPAQLDADPVEVFGVTRRLDLQVLDVYSSTLDFSFLPSSFTVGGASFSLSQVEKNRYRYHPLAVAGALLFSTSRGTTTPEKFDVLSGNMGADLAFLFDENIFADMHRLILDGLGQQQQIDQFFIGAGGESVAYMREIQEKLLAPWGYSFGVTDLGKLTVFRMELVDVDSFAEASQNTLSPIGGKDAVYAVDNGQGSVIDAVEAKLGGTPYSKGRAITLKADDGQPDRTLALRSGGRARLDLSTLDARQSAGEATIKVIARALAQHFAVRRLRVRVDDPQRAGTTLDLGAYCVLDGIQIRDPWLVDEGGTRVRGIGQGAKWVGQIVSREPVDGFAGAEIEVLIQSDAIVRKRAPSGVVVSSTTNTVEIEPSTFSGGSDADQFNVGDELKIIEPDGSTRDGSAVSVTGISDGDSDGINDTLTVSPNWTSAPQAGDYVRLADFGDYDNTTINAYVERVYVYLADSAGTLGTAGETADIYGI